MIQRIQSIFLLLAGLAILGLFIFPFATSAQGDQNLFQDKLFNIMDHPILLVLTCLAAGLAIANIFLFKNRDLQIKLSYGIIVLSILLPIVAFFLVYQSGVESGALQIRENYLGLAMPILAILFGFLASKYIKKDHKLVKSMDRLR